MARSTKTPTKAPAKKAPVKNGRDDGRVQMQFRISPENKERLRNEALRRQVSTNYLIETALAESMSRWEREKL